MQSRRLPNEVASGPEIIKALLIAESQEEQGENE